MCYAVLVSSSALYLLDDAGATFLGPVAPGSSQLVANSSCQINGPSSSVTSSGATQTLTLNLTFEPAFAGTKTISAQVQTAENALTGPKTLGTWTAQ
jgi:hypothetical protein